MLSLAGKIYVLGGTGILGSSVLESTDGAVWEETTPLAQPRRGHTAVGTEALLCN